MSSSVQQVRVRDHVVELRVGVVHAEATRGGSVAPHVRELDTHFSQGVVLRRGVLEVGVVYLNLDRRPKQEVFKNDIKCCCISENVLFLQLVSGQLVPRLDEELPRIGINPEQVVVVPAHDPEAHLRAAAVVRRVTPAAVAVVRAQGGLRSVDVRVFVHCDVIRVVVESRLKVVDWSNKKNIV